MNTEKEAWPDESRLWTAEQHRLMACRLLDGNHAASVGETSDDPADPPWRQYEALDRDEDRSDLGPFLAALAHAVLAVTPPGKEPS